MTTPNKMQLSLIVRGQHPPGDIAGHFRDDIELVRADAIFCATGVTKGALLDGVKFKDGFVHTHTLVMNSGSRTVREVRMKRPA